MRLTLINQFYPPDLAPTGHMAASLAEHRASLGDRVTVVASLGGYVPESKAKKGSRSGNPRLIRLWTPRLGKGSSLKRIADYALFYLQAMLRMATLPRQDLIISLTTPPFIAWTAVLHRRLHPSTRLILWSMDCYPEVPERAGVIRSGGWVSRLMRRLNQGLFRHLDSLICLDRAMAGLLSSQYIDSRLHLPVSIIPNWEPAGEFAEDLAPPMWEPARELRTRSRFLVLYLGNAGYGHRFETVLEAAQGLHDEGVDFVFVGGGERWAWLESAREARGLKNVHLFRYVPKEITPAVMASADCALITLRDSYLGVISPSKLHANLAMGLPILYIGPEGGNVDEAIRHFDCGISLRHGDAEGAISFIRKLRSEAAWASEIRSRARGAFEQAYSDAKTLPQFDSVIDSLQS